MRILNTKRVVAVLVTFAAMTTDTCLLPLSAGLKLNSEPRPQRNGELQALAIQAGQKIPESAISVETALVNLDVLVTDQDGRVLSGLKKENFRLLDNGRAQVITHFEPTGARITIAMLMEYSGSAYNYFAYKAASWGSNFLNHLEPLDCVALVTYEMKPTDRSPRSGLTLLGIRPKCSRR